jgi:hypothetical protein
MKLLLVLTALLLMGTANAMPIPQYDKMDYHDQAHYATLLIKGVYLDLTAQGQKDKAETLLSLFKDNRDKGGWDQFGQNLNMIRNLNQSNASDPNYKKPPYEVEHAMALTLKNAAIVVTVSRLLEINKEFKPAYPTK